MVIVLSTMYQVRGTKYEVPACGRQAKYVSRGTISPSVPARRGGLGLFR